MRRTPTTPRRRGRQSQAAGAPTRAEAAYQELRRGILSGEYPPAAPLSEYQLAANLRLSRTPVREALARLEHERLVRTVGGRGCFVAELTPNDIIEIYQVREPLESSAARISAERMTAEGIATLESIVAQMRDSAKAGYAEETFVTDVDLHKTIVRTTQNSRMSAILDTLDDQMHRIRSMWPRTPRWLDGAVEEHAAIVGSIAARDPDGAERAMRTHLRSSCDHAIRFLMPTREY